MNLPPVSTSEVSAVRPPGLRPGETARTEKEKLADACRQFEAVLLRQILAQARQPVFNSSLTPSSAVSGIYQDMVTSQLADSVSRSGEFGLARSLLRQLERQTDTSS